MDNYNKEQILNYYKEKLNEMISSDDFPRFFNNFDMNKIMKYSELQNYDSITDFIPNNIDLLPNDFDYRLILIEQAKNSGHWTVLVRFKNNIYYFDSYGVKPDGEWKFIPNYVRKMLNQETNELTRLLNQAKKDGFNVSFNKVKYQEDAPHINTCGRYCICVIKLLEKGYNLDDVERILNEGCEKFNTNYDCLMVRWFA